MRQHRQIVPLDVGKLLSPAQRAAIAERCVGFYNPKLRRMIAYERQKAAAIVRMAGIDAMPKASRLALHESGRRTGYDQTSAFKRAVAAAKRRNVVKALLATAIEKEKRLER